ncbi:hypothetical protein LXL04_007708 [Taraxacum kok-saghyz]
MAGDPCELDVIRNVYMLVLILLCLNGGIAMDAKFVGNGKIGKGYTVQIKSDIPNEDIMVHCKSKDTNIGYHVLNSSNLELSWSFRENIWGTTLYFCHFWRKMAEQKFDVFNITMFVWCDHGFDIGNNCNWEIKDDGFYFFDFHYQTWSKEYDWKPRAYIS